MTNSHKFVTHIKMSLYDTCLGQNWLTKLLFWNCWPWSYCIGIVYRLGIINQVRNVGTPVIWIFHLSTGMAAISPRTKGFGCTKYNLKLASLETCTHASLLCTWAESRRGLQWAWLIAVAMVANNEKHAIRDTCGLYYWIQSILKPDILPNLMDLLCLCITQVPKSWDLANFVSTTTMTSMRSNKVMSITYTLAE